MHFYNYINSTFICCINCVYCRKPNYISVTACMTSGRSTCVFLLNLHCSCVCINRHPFVVSIVVVHRTHGYNVYPTRIEIDFYMGSIDSFLGTIIHGTHIRPITNYIFIELLPWIVTKWPATSSAPDVLHFGARRQVNYDWPAKHEENNWDKNNLHLYTPDVLMHDTYIEVLDKASFRLMI
jgi:hypothetical protein